MQTRPRCGDNMEVNTGMEQVRSEELEVSRIYERGGLLSGQKQWAL